MNTFKSKWLGLINGLWFIPASIVALFAVLAVLLVQLDQDLSSQVAFIFNGDAQAARTVLSVIAGSLITVAGLTLSVTIVVLQLASSQFTPRVLRNFFADRVTQLTVGALVGIFVYSLLVLRSVGAFEEDGGFVPRLAVTVASALALLAVVMLVVFIHHISQRIQVSHIAADIARDTLARVDDLYPEPYGEPVEQGQDLLDEWRQEEPALIYPKRAGYVQRIGLDDLASELSAGVDYIEMKAAPGDFVSLETPLAGLWPKEKGDACEEEVRKAFLIDDERDLHQDVAFGMRQLTDIAVRALSPSLNDPTTAVTCLGYLKAILVRLTTRSFPSPVRRFDGLVSVSRRRGYDEHLSFLLEIGRYARGDARVVVSLLSLLDAVAGTALESDAPDRLASVVHTAELVATQALDEAKSDEDRRAVEEALQKVGKRGRAIKVG